MLTKKCEQVQNLVQVIPFISSGVSTSYYYIYVCINISHAILWSQEEKNENKNLVNPNVSQRSHAK